MCYDEERYYEEADRAYDEWRESLSPLQYEQHKRKLTLLGRGVKLMKVYRCSLLEPYDSYYIQVNETECVGFTWESEDDMEQTRLWLMEDGVNPSLLTTPLETVLNFDDITEV